MKKELNLTGRVNNKGKMEIYATDEMNDWLRKFPNHRIMINLRVLNKGASWALKGYYYLKVVPDIKSAINEQGDHKTMKTVERELRMISPVCWDERFDPETGQHYDNLLEIVDLDNIQNDICELDNSKLLQHIEFLKQYAAENWGVFIDDPKTIIK